jgi:hypothetical protein
MAKTTTTISLSDEDRATADNLGHLILGQANLSGLIAYLIRKEDRSQSEC